jgi:TetR/AcrR family transcriptional regulator, cholesterol catabolism regulator
VVVGSSTLTKSQAARRQRVIQAALQLASHGGYDAVQMRDVAATADVALGTIYRYFSSKDHLLAAAMVEWVDDLERRVAQRPPQGSTTAERVLDVLRRALRAMEREPRLGSAVVGALTSADAEAGACMVEVTGTMARIMQRAFPDDVAADTEADVTRVLGHVWWSCLVSWVNGLGDMAWVGDELDTAAHLLLDSYG